MKTEEQVQQGMTERRRAEETVRRVEAETLRQAGEQVMWPVASAAITSTVDLGEVLVRIAEQMCRAADVTSTYICGADAERGTSAVLAEHYSANASKQEKGSDLGATSAEDARFLETLRAGQPHVVHVDDGELPEDDRRHLLARGAQSVLYVPLSARGQTIGYAELRESRQRREFTPEQIALCQAIAQRAAVAIDSARLYEEAQARSRYLETLQQINVTLRSTLPLSQVLETITQGAGEALGYMGSFVAMPDAAGERLTMRGAWGSRFLDTLGKLTGLEVASFSLPLTAEENPIVRAYLSGQLQVWDKAPDRIALGVEPAISPKVATRISRALEAVAAACVPLPIGERVVGVLVVFSPREQLVGDERDMLLGLADQAGLAIENARLYAEAQRRAKELATLNKTGQTLTSTLDLEEVLTQALAEVRALLGAEAASVLLHDAVTDELVFAASVGSAAESLSGMRMPATEGIAGWALGEARPVLIRDARDDPRFYDRVDAVTGLSTRSLLAVPLVWKGKAVGVIEAINRADKAFDKHDMDLLSTLAGSAAIAIENARLYEETARRLAETRVLQEVMLAAASTLDFDQVLTRAIQAIHRTLGTEYLTFALPDESGEYLVPHPSLIGYESMPEEGVRLPLDASTYGRVYATGEAELANDATETSYLFESVPGLHSELAVPVRVGDGVIAVLCAESPRPAAFSDEDLRTFEAIAAQLGVVMDNARLYEAEREQRRLVEQSQAQLVQSEKLAATGRLAASLAHEINNPLQAIHNSLQLMLSYPLEPNEQREYLQMADEEVRQLIGIVGRMLGFARRPQREKEPTDVNQVIERVLALSGKYLQHRHIVLRRDLSSHLPAIPAAADELAHVFLNLVLNAVDAMPKGGTLHVSSRLGGDGRLAATFSDTGQGIPPEHLDRIFEPFFSTKDSGTGLGLAVSHNVVERHRGEITVQSAVGEGTSFTVWLPVLQEQAGEKKATRAKSQSS